MAIDMEYERLWHLLTELSKQLTLNRQHCDALQKQADDLKTQAIHNSSGFTLRRFNTDISQEQFETELERLNATLVLENHALQHESKQLSMLLKDYEGTLDTIMGRFRTFAHSTQEHDLSLARHYETILQTERPNQTNPDLSPMHDPFAVQQSLFRISDLLRKAMRSAQGEDTASDSSSSDFGDDANLQVGGFGAPPPNDDNAKLGGYLALLGKKAHHSKGNNGIDDQALERDIEMERLRTENELLRQLVLASGTSLTDD